MPYGHNITELKFMTSDRDKICRICGEKIVKNTWCLQMTNIHVSPKHVSLFFHEGCFTRAFDHAVKTRNNH